MRLGEGSGAVAAVPVLRSAVALLRDVALLSEPARLTTVRDGWRLAVGTLTAVPVPAARRVDRRAPAGDAARAAGRAAARGRRGARGARRRLVDLPPLAVASVVALALAPAAARCTGTACPTSPTG